MKNEPPGNEELLKKVKQIKFQSKLEAEKMAKKFIRTREKLGK